MIHTLTRVTFGALLVLVSSTALADSAQAGHKGTVTAYETDGTTVIDVRVCPMKKGIPDYVACGKAFREDVNEKLCSSRGKGNHKWLYRVSNGKSKLPATARCK